LTKITELTKKLFILSRDEINIKNDTVLRSDNNVKILFNKKIENIEILLKKSHDNLDYWEKELNNVNNLKYLKTKAERNEYILNAENGIKLWEDEIARLKNEMTLP
jgi:hypothetical protein